MDKEEGGKSLDVGGKMKFDLCHIMYGRDKRVSVLEKIILATKE